MLGVFHENQKGEAASRPVWLSPGQSAVEFALAVPTFLLMIFLVMDFGRLFFVQANVQQAVLEGARYASMGTHQSGTNSGTGLPYTRVQSIQSYVQQQAAVSMGLGATLSSVQVSSTLGGAGSAGGPQDIEIISMTTTLPLITPLVSRFFPGGQYTFTATATVKNEPFPPSETK